MGLLFRVLYAVHARGTHHKLALDGLSRLSGPDAERWQRLFLKHAEPFMVGAKAPDDTFKDFKNHVLHVRDGFWGGAPETARAWYDKLVAALQAGAWPDAAYAAGVLSHYVTDPVHPFHTGQTEAENAIHRAFEWSTAKSYDALKTAAASQPPIPVPPATDRPDWLQEMLRQAATASNRHYEKLIAHYDIHRGVVDPPAGLDPIAQRIVGSLIGLASGLFTAVLERALAEARVTPPDVSLTLEAVLATVQIPLKALRNRLADKSDQREVERIYDELRATGTVEANLSADDRLVRDLHRAEVLAAPAAPQSQPKAVAPAAKPAPVAPRSEPSLASLERPARAAGPIGPSVPIVSGKPAAAISPRPVAVMPETVSAPPPPTVDRALSALSLISAPPTATVTPVAIPPAPPLAVEDTGADLRSAAPHEASGGRSARLVERVAAAVEPAPPSDPVPAPSPVADETRSNREPDVLAREPLAAEPLAPEPMAMTTSRRRIRLALADPVVDAPSIGPRMAERLRTVGIETVGDLVQTRAERIADGLGRPAVHADTIVAWQAQSRLVMAVPGLTGTGAQLFVGAGFTKVDEIAAVEPDVLCARVLAFAATLPGQRILRDGQPPDIERIKGWADGAREALAA